MHFNEILQLLNFLSPTVLFIGICIGYSFYNRLDSVHKWIVYYLSAMILVDLSSRIFKGDGNNLIILPAFSLIEVLLFIFLFKKYLFTNKHNVLTFIGIAGVIYILAEIIINFVLNKVDAKNFQPYAKVVDNFIVILYAFGFFHEKINVFKESKWNHFRLNAIIIIFFSLNMIFFLPFNFLINESSGLKFYFWLSNLIITVLFYSYLTHSIWKNGRTRKLLPSGSR